MSDSEFAEVEKIIGYEFKDKTLLKVALTHTSYANENSCESNQRLEFLGDRVVNFAVAESLYESISGEEGELNRELSSVVSEVPLAAAVRDMKLLDYCAFGKGLQKNLSSLKDKHISDIFEAVAAAIYLDGGMECARRFVFEKLLNAGYRAPSDYKTALKEYLDKRGELIKFECIEENGRYESRITVCGKEFCGFGDRKIAAEQNAAKAALEYLNEEN